MNEFILIAVAVMAILGFLYLRKIKREREQEKIDAATYERWVQNGAKFAEEPEEKHD